MIQHVFIRPWNRLKILALSARHKKFLLYVSCGALALAILTFLQCVYRGFNQGTTPDYAGLAGHCIISFSLIPIFALVVLRIQQKWKPEKRYWLIHTGLCLLTSSVILLLIAIDDLLFFYELTWPSFYHVITFHVIHYFNFIILVYWSILLLATWFDKKEKVPATIAEQPATAIQYPERIPVKDKETTVFIPVAAINWVQASDNYVKLYVNNHFYLERITLKEMAALLDPALFKQAHRSAVVNVQQVQSITVKSNGSKIITLLDGQEISLTRKYKDNFKELSRKGV